ncbi:unnamed protein product [Phyllotreta striolata]|uniref:Uncharacterized protein n=1 Tax=Phyllotreta striolata TaxID=444603 RepID=A0A9N9XIS5_PHYSR|nr:unnamed protein product [Phyllotreta striolata]
MEKTENSIIKSYSNAKNISNSLEETIIGLKETKKQLDVKFNKDEIIGHSQNKPTCIHVGKSCAKLLVEYCEIGNETFQQSIETSQQAVDKGPILESIRCLKSHIKETDVLLRYFNISLRGMDLIKQSKTEAVNEVESITMTPSTSSSVLSDVSSVNSSVNFNDFIKGPKKETSSPRVMKN